MAALGVSLAMGLGGWAADRWPVRIARLPPIDPPTPTVDDGDVPVASAAASDALPPTNRAAPQAAQTLTVSIPEIPVDDLESAWSIALAVDPALEAQRRYASAAEFTWHASRAESLPTLTTGVDYTLRDNEPAFVFAPGTPAPYAQREGIGYFAAVRVPLFTGGSVAAAADAAQLHHQGRQFDVQIAAQDVKYRVAEEYVAVLRASSDVALAQSAVDSLAAHAHDVAMLYRHEQRPKNDLLAAQVALADARHELLAIENALDVARATFNRRLGRPLDAPVRLADLQLMPVPDSLDDLQQVACAGRPELSQLAADAHALSLQAESIRAKRRPQADLLGVYDFNENRYQSPEGIASVGVGVTWTLYDAGRLHHRACALEQQASALHRLRTDLETRIALDVRRCWLEAHQTRRRIAVTHEALAQAEENLRVARERYINGMGTNSDVLAAESLRMQSFRNHHHAWYDAILASLRLERAIGRL